jgi:hypothetical protein
MAYDKKREKEQWAGDSAIQNPGINTVSGPEEGERGRNFVKLIQPLLLSRFGRWEGLRISALKGSMEGQANQ